MKYQNYKLWLTLDLESVDYKRISAFLHSKLLEEYKFNAKKDVSNVLSFDEIDFTFKDENEIISNLAYSSLFFLKYKDDLIKDSYNVESKIDNSKKFITKKKNIKIKSISLNTLKGARPIKSSIVEDVKIIDDNTLIIKANGKLVKVTITCSDIIKSENDLSFEFKRPIKAKIKKSDSIESKSKLKINILIRENNTIGRLKDYTLESLANKNLYYLGYIQL